MVFPAKSYRFDTVLLLVYVVARLMYLNGVQEKILPKVVTCHNFLKKAMLSQLATQRVVNSHFLLHHDHIITILVMKNIFDFYCGAYPVMSFLIFPLLLMYLNIFF